jgi:hypothetical protein
MVSADVHRLVCRSATSVIIAATLTGQAAQPVDPIQPYLDRKANRHGGAVPSFEGNRAPQLFGEETHQLHA